jgi:hypothetical protein
VTRRWYVLTSFGFSAPYASPEAAHEAADGIGLPVVAIDSTTEVEATEWERDQTSRQMAAGAYAQLAERAATAERREQT